MEGRKPPSKYRPSPWSQMFSIVDRDDTKTFSASAAACLLSGRPKNGASTVFRTYPARTKTSRLGHEKRGSGRKIAHKRKHSVFTHSQRKILIRNYCKEEHKLTLISMALPDSYNSMKITLSSMRSKKDLTYYTLSSAMWTYSKKLNHDFLVNLIELHYFENEKINTK